MIMQEAAEKPLPLFVFYKCGSFKADKLWFILLTEPLKYLSPLKGEMSRSDRGVNQVCTNLVNKV